MQKYAKISKNIQKYAKISKNMQKYPKISNNIPQPIAYQCGECHPGLEGEIAADQLYDGEELLVELFLVVLNFVLFEGGFCLYGPLDHVDDEHDHGGEVDDEVIPLLIGVQGLFADESEGAAHDGLDLEEPDLDLSLALA